MCLMENSRVLSPPESGGAKWGKQTSPAVFFYSA
jgi:hypothetical protein